MRDIYNLPRNARTYLVENILSSHHGFKSDITSRFQKFAKSLFSCPIPAVRVLASMLRTDVRSVFGNNIAFLTREIGKNPLEISRSELIRKISCKQPPPPGNEFMLDVFNELYDCLQDGGTGAVETEEIHVMLHVLSVS